MIAVGCAYDMTGRLPYGDRFQSRAGTSDTSVTTAPGARTAIPTKRPAWVNALLDNDGNTAPMFRLASASRKAWA
jgi:hypothetical protein